MGGITNKYARDVYEAARALCRAAGGDCRLDTGSSRGHAKIILQINGKTRATPLSTTPRNPADAVRYKLADVRRLLREMAA